MSRKVRIKDAIFGKKVFNSKVELEYYKKYGDIYRYNGVSHNASRNSMIERGGLQDIFKNLEGVSYEQ